MVAFTVFMTQCRKTFFYHMGTKKTWNLWFIIFHAVVSASSFLQLQVQMWWRYQVKREMSWIWCSQFTKWCRTMMWSQLGDMINSVVKMKFFEAAYNLLNEMTELDIQLTSQLYNMAGYFRENNICRGLAVLKQMKNADVKPGCRYILLLDILCYKWEGGCKVSDAFQIYEEIKQAGDVPKSKAIRSLIGSLGKQGDFVEMFHLV